MNEQEKVKAVLNAALGELDSSDDEEGEPNEAKPTVVTVASENRPFFGPVRPSTPPPSRNDSNTENSNKKFTDMVEDMLLTDQHVSDNDHGEEARRKAEEQMLQFMQQIESQLKDLDKEENKTPSNLASPPAAVSSDSSAPTNHTKNEVDQAISNLIQDMAQTNLNEDDLKGLLDGLDADDEAALIDGMMEQLLSRELMYEPMKQVASKFPLWLENNKEHLSEQEYQQRSQQCACFQELVQVYESNGGIQQLMVLMERAQEFGQPPVQIVQEIAPGIELDDNGLPKLGNDDCRMM